MSGHVKKREKRKERRKKEEEKVLSLFFLTAQFTVKRASWT